MWSQLKNNEYFKKQEPTNLWRSDPTKEWSKPGNIEKQIGQKTLFRKK